MAGAGKRARAAGLRNHQRAKYPLMPKGQDLKKNVLAFVVGRSKIRGMKH